MLWGFGMQTITCFRFTVLWPCSILCSATRAEAAEMYSARARARACNVWAVDSVRLCRRAEVPFDAAVQSASPTGPRLNSTCEPES